MPEILAIQPQTIVYSASQYPRSAAEVESMGLTGGRNKEVRALTIAAFRVAQNNTQLSTRTMDRELLLFLVAGSTTALSYWAKEGRLTESAAGYALTPAGLAECQNTLLGQAGGYSTTEEAVQEWVVRLLCGDNVATKSRAFPARSWSLQ